MWVTPVSSPSAAITRMPRSMAFDHSGPEMLRGSTTIHWPPGVSMASSVVGEYCDSE